MIFINDALKVYRLSGSIICFLHTLAIKHHLATIETGAIHAIREGAVRHKFRIMTEKTEALLSILQIL